MNTILRNPLGTTLRVSENKAEWMIRVDGGDWRTAVRFYSTGLADSFLEFMQLYAGFKRVEDSGKDGG